VLSPRRAAAVADAVRARMAACALDLRGAVVATECANDAYAVTAAAAVAAGAETWAFARANRYASAEQAEADVRAVIAALDADPALLHVVQERTAIPWPRVDLVTNSGHLRPIDGGIVAQLSPRAVVALMFEAWELRDGDIDVATCARRGVAVVGVDEHHPACGSFERVGSLAVSEAMRQQWSVDGAKVAVVGDGPFVAPVVRALQAAGAVAVVAVVPDEAGLAETPPCAVVAPFGPHRAHLAVACAAPASVCAATGRTGWSAAELAHVCAATGAYGVIQLWGDLDREFLANQGVVVAPSQAPPPGHQGVPMNAAGHEAVVRLQVAGLAAAWHHRIDTQGPLAALAQPVAIHTANQGTNP